MSSPSRHSLWPRPARWDRSSRAAALQRATGARKVYVGLFAEAKAFPHIHIHLIPRPRRLAARLRGPLIFALMRTDKDRAPLADAVRIAERTRRSLGASRSKDR